ncbi:MarR family winged helix-turn-helix transcriptional regulator [Fodinicola feengrottensis]|uniref:HTH marR-type domain-containing protein n=2 Tax=Fodinicola feengrottensis TaxID=435914 RepID=A0ABN2I6H1_9ACTN|nr:MarR family transcriptional regulator [Fodinicola feengrottensis]
MGRVDRSPELLPVADEPLRAIADSLVDTTSRLIRMVARERAGAGTLPSSQVLLLALLDDLGSTRITRLAEYEHCSQPAITALVARLEVQGLVRRDADESDRRAVLVSITDFGLARLAESRRALSARIMMIFDDLSADEQRRLGEAVTEIQTLLGLSGRPVDPRSDTKHVSGPVPGA